MVGSWSGMAGKIAEATGAETPGERHDTILKERRTMKDKWVSGEITDEQWKPFIRQSGKAEDRLLAVRGFQTDYMGQMQGLSVLRERGYARIPIGNVRANVRNKYAARRDGTGKRLHGEESLTALADSFKDDKERAQKQLAAEERTAKATEEIAAEFKKGTTGEPQSATSKDVITPSHHPIGPCDRTREITEQ